MSWGPLPPSEPWSDLEPNGRFRDLEIHGRLAAESVEIEGDLTLGGSITLDAGGSFRTATSGGRIEITETDVQSILFYTGLATESLHTELEANVVSDGGTDYPMFTIWGPKATGDFFPAYIRFHSDGGRAGFSHQLLLYAHEGIIRYESLGGGHEFYDDGALRFDITNADINFRDDAGVIVGYWDESADRWKFEKDFQVDSPWYLRDSGGTIRFAVTDTDLRFYDDGGSTTFYWDESDDVWKSNKAFRWPSGSVSAPTITFVSNSDLGFYRYGASEMAATAGGRLGWRLKKGSTYTEYRNPDAYTVTQSASTLTISSTGLIRRTSSSRKYKELIRYDVQDELAAIELKPTHFLRRQPDEDAEGNVTTRRLLEFGLIAEDVAEQHPHLGRYSLEGGVEDFDDRGVLAVLAAKNNMLERRVAALET